MRWCPLDILLYYYKAMILITKVLLRWNMREQTEKINR